MNIQEFIDQLDVVFEETNITTLKPDTEFRQLAEWDSMTALSLIAMADENFNVRLTGEDIRNSVTIEDLYVKLKEKK